MRRKLALALFRAALRLEPAIEAQLTAELHEVAAAALHHGQMQGQAALLEHQHHIACIAARN